MKYKIACLMYRFKLEILILPIALSNHTLSHYQNQKKVIINKNALVNKILSLSLSSIVLTMKMNINRK